MIPQAEADRICRRANELKELRDELERVDPASLEIAEIDRCIWYLRRYVCGAPVIRFHWHNYIIARQSEYVTTLEAK